METVVHRNTSFDQKMMMNPPLHHNSDYSNPQSDSDADHRPQISNGPRVILKGRPPRGPVHNGVKIINLVTCYRKCGLLSLANYLPHQVWLVTDCCGIVCAVFTWFLILYASFVVNWVVIGPYNGSTYKWLNFIVYNILSFLAFSSHSRAMFADPGAIPKGNATHEHIQRLGLKHGQIVYKCPKCESIKPDRTHHCSVCGRCVQKMDHHCPWVNNCVGEFNQKYFALFTLYICGISCHSIFMAVMHFIYCVQDNWQYCPAFSPPAQTVFLIFLIFEGLLFGIFTAIMFGTQIQAICMDETGIESLKGEDATWEKGSAWLNVKSVFGHPFSWRWFSPFHTPANNGKQETYQYTV